MYIHNIYSVSNCEVYMWVAKTFLFILNKCNLDNSSVDLFNFHLLSDKNVATGKCVSEKVLGTEACLFCFAV